MRLRGFEPPTTGFEVRCSIQMSYRRILAKDAIKKKGARSLFPAPRVPSRDRTDDNQIHNLALYR